MTSKKHPAAHPAQAEPPPVESDDSRLDEALDESFPASDPIAVDTTDPHRSSEKETSSQGKKQH
ncbi:hypothetical protein [Paraburkholderia dilworthii]|uniref:YfhD family protein n=1 Tax=Paraburkholderia dilworthii TaxID=948106 RepID=A0ABW9DEB4_9BURK